MKLRRNIVANYLSQAFTAAVGILTVPAYVRYMGAEAYGLVSFYAMLQAWFLILDMGLSTTLSREVARYNGGATRADTLVQLKRLLEYIFVALAVLAAVVFYVGGGVIAASWLQVRQLPLTEVVHSIQLMGLVIAARWMSCLYRGVVSGFEQQVWLSGFNAFIATCRFVLSIPLVAYIDNRPSTFFAYQASVTALELVWLYWKAGTLLPTSAGGTGAVSGWDWTPLRPALKFASGIAFTSVVWVLVTQVDKLALSKILPLGQYGTFTMAVLLAGGINLLSGPISTALVPRLTNIAAANIAGELETVYRRFTQLVGVATVPAALILWAFSTPILRAWTGNLAIAIEVGPVLGLYALGNAALSLGAFAYYLQYANGNVRLHLIGNALFVVLYLPLVVWAAKTAGGLGAAWAWLIMNVLYLAIWVPVVHARFLPQLHWRWLVDDVLKIAGAAALPLTVLIWLPVPSSNRFDGAITAGVFGIASLICAGAASSFVRTAVIGRFGRRVGVAA